MSDNKTSVYYRKSAHFVRIARYTVTFMLILFLLLCILLFGEDITAENVQLLAKYITINEGSSSLYTDEFSISSNEDSKIHIISDNLAVINKNNLSLYDLAGHKLFSYDYTYSTPASYVNDRNIVVHDISGKEVSVFNTFSKIKSIEYPNGVADAFINDNGLAVISNEESYRSCLYVYNQDFEEKFKLFSSNNYFTCVNLSNDADFVLASYVASKAGSFTSGISVYDTRNNSSSPLMNYQLINELPVYAAFSDDEQNIFVVTDSAVHFFDSNLKPISSYKFNQSKIKDYFVANGKIVLTERNNLSGNTTEIIGLSFTGQKLFSFNVADEIDAVTIGKNKLFALGTGAIYEFSGSDNTYKQTSSSLINEKYNTIVCDSADNCYVTTNTRFKRIDFNKQKENNQ